MKTEGLPHFGNFFAKIEGALPEISSAWDLLSSRQFGDRFLMAGVSIRRLQLAQDVFEDGDEVLGL